MNSGTNVPISTQPKRVFKKPSLEDVRTYCEERNNGIDANAFIDYYESNGWKVGRNPMKDWKAAVRGWASRDRDGTVQPAQKNPALNYAQRDYTGESGSGIEYIDFSEFDEEG